MMKKSNILLLALVSLVFVFIGIDLISIQAKIKEDVKIEKIIRNNPAHPFDDITELIAKGAGKVNIVQGSSNSLKYQSKEPATLNYSISNGVLTVNGHNSEEMLITVKTLDKLTASGDTRIVIDSIVMQELSIVGKENAGISLNLLTLKKLTIVATDSVWIDQDARKNIYDLTILTPTYIDSVDIKLTKAAHTGLRRTACGHLNGRLDGTGFFNIYSAKTVNFQGIKTGFSARGNITKPN